MFAVSNNKVVYVLILTFAMGLLHLSLYAAGATRYNIDDNGKKMTFMDIIHFTIVTQYTVGYGDIYPVNAVARILSWIHMMLFFMIAIA
jgi:hypothetical protein